MNEHVIAVTGATGVTGLQLAPRLTERGLNIRYLVRDLDKARVTLGPALDHGAELVAADLDDRASYDRALQGVHTLYLNSGHSPVLEQQQTNAIEAAVAKLQAASHKLAEVVYADAQADAGQQESDGPQPDPQGAQEDSGAVDADFEVVDK